MFSCVVSDTTKVLRCFLPKPIGLAKDNVGDFPISLEYATCELLLSLIRNFPALQIKGNSLLTTAALNYESPSRVFSVVVESSDSGVPSKSLVKVFAVKVTDVNEAPASVKLSSDTVEENAAKGKIVGSFVTSDPDNWGSTMQRFKYSLRDSAGGRFAVDGSVLKVRA